MKTKQNIVNVFGAKLAAGAVHVGKEVEANFRAWFERNFVNRQAGRIGHVSYSRAGVMDDRPGDGMWYAEALDRAWEDYRAPLTASEMGYITAHPLIAFQLTVGITDLRGVRCMIRGLTQCTNRLQQRAYRSRYYGRDNARRRMLAAERRKITKRTTTNPCPTPEEFREAFVRVKESVAAKLLFGGMVHDLACYVDSCLRYDGAGNITGRNGGIKEWIAENVPELCPRYKTIMRYKALAMRFRQAMDVKDPEPTSALLEETPFGQGMGRETSGEKTMGERTGGKKAGKDKVDGKKTGNKTIGKGNVDDKKGGGRKIERRKGGGDENYYAQDSHYSRRGRAGETDDIFGKRIMRMRERARKLLGGCGNTFKDVFNRIDAVLGVDIDTIRGVDIDTIRGVDGNTTCGVDGNTTRGVDGNTARCVDGNTIRSVDGNTARCVDGNTIRGVDGNTARGVNVDKSLAVNVKMLGITACL